MTMFMYKARDTPIIVIIRRESKTTLELIVWNTDTDTFTRGQWLKHIISNCRYFSISPDGSHLAYFYTSLKTPDKWTSHAVISKLPYFSASFHTKEHSGMYDRVSFDLEGNFMHTSSELVKKAPSELIQVPWNKDKLFSGYQEEPFMDSRGRLITKEAFKILVDGVVILDTSEDVFHPLPPPF